VKDEYRDEKKLVVGVALVIFGIDWLGCFVPEVYIHLIASAWMQTAMIEGEPQIGHYLKLTRTSGFDIGNRHYSLRWPIVVTLW
jgi:hypothetical protein